MELIWGNTEIAQEERGATESPAVKGRKFSQGSRRVVAAGGIFNRGSVWCPSRHSVPSSWIDFFLEQL